MCCWLWARRWCSCWDQQRWFAANWRELGRPLIVDYVDRLAAEVGSPPSVARAQAITARLPVAIRIQGPVVQWDSQPERDRWHDRDHHAQRAWRGSNRQSLLTRRTADGHLLVFGVSDWPEAGPGGPGWAMLAVLLGLTAGGFWYLRRMFRPLDDIGAGVQRFGEGHFEQAIPVRRPDELGRLAAQVNTMANKLAGMLAGQRGLLLAISHELRSPLTRARLNAELVAEGPERDALLRDMAVMRDLINDLLESERLAAGEDALRREPVDLATLLAQVVADDPADRTVGLHLPASLPMLNLDRARAQLLVRNLLDNAWRHGGGTAVEVSAETAKSAPASASEPNVSGESDGPAPGHWLVVQFRDHGPGVDEAQRARLAEPFFRPDAARSRDRGGVGLGLYLCRLVAESHGGSLKFLPGQPGLRVQWWLPLSAEP